MSDLQNTTQLNVSSFETMV